MKLHIIYTENDMLLSKKSYTSWREIQDEFADYKTSLGPWSDKEVVEFLSDEYSDLQPTAQEQVTALLSENEEIRKVSFRS